VPYVLRHVGDATLDAISPYGYSGIYAAPDCSPTDFARFWSQAVAHWRDVGVVTMFLRFSPLDMASVEAARGLAAIEMVRRGDTITVPVEGGASHVWEAMEGRCRTAIRKAHNAGMKGEIRLIGAADVSSGSTFRRLYEETMVRVGSSPGYVFRDAYYHRLVDGLGKGLFMAEVRDPSGDVVSSALVLRHRDRAHYHLAGSDQDGTNNLLLWTILQWAAESGCVVVNLGGGLRPDDSLFLFKRSFGGARTSFWTGAVVLDVARYDALLAEHAKTIGRSIEDLRTSGFFPGYRLGRS
jgi:Acetyltransferase (GNAT) domain